MSGGVSHLDTFDPKPALHMYAGQPLTGKGEIVVRQGNPGPLMPSPFQFRKYGQCGMDVSELFPLVARHVDEMAFLRSVFGKSNDHVQASYELNTGKIQMGLPSVGSAERTRLPVAVVLNPMQHCYCGLGDAVEGTMMNDASNRNPWQFTHR
jgi:hypothetical protein